MTVDQVQQHNKITTKLANSWGLKAFPENQLRTGVAYSLRDRRNRIVVYVMPTVRSNSMFTYLTFSTSKKTMVKALDYAKGVPLILLVQWTMRLRWLRADNYTPDVGTIRRVKDRRITQGTDWGEISFEYDVRDFHRWQEAPDFIN